MAKKSAGKILVKFTAAQILAKAQILSNKRGLPVIIGADWNIQVQKIKLPDRAIMACPESSERDNDLESSFEDDGIDAIIMLTPEVSVFYSYYDDISDPDFSAYGIERTL